MGDSLLAVAKSIYQIKCVQLVQGVFMLISITIILLFNFEKNISYVFLFLRNFKISFPLVFTVYFFLF